MRFLATVMLGTAGTLGWIGVSWYWCILTAIFNCPIYYSGKPEGQMASDINNFGGPKWLAWFVLSMPCEKR